MRVFKDYEDYKKNADYKKNVYHYEKGVSEEFLNDYYGGDIKKAEDDNISNKGCFDCVKCVMCEKCVRCGYLANCYDCFETGFGSYLRSVGNGIQSKQKEKSNE